MVVSSTDHSCAIRHDSSIFDHIFLFFFQKGDYIAGPTRGDLWSYAQLTVTVFFILFHGC